MATVYGEEMPGDEPAATDGHESEVSEYDSAESEAEWEASEKAKLNKGYDPNANIPHLEMLHQDHIDWDENIPYLFTGSYSLEDFLVDHDSKEYRKGGEVFRVIVNQEQAVDIMLCETGDCYRCSQLSDAHRYSIKTDHRPIVHASETTLVEGNTYAFVPSPKAYKKSSIHGAENRFVNFEGVWKQVGVWTKVCDLKTCEQCQAAMGTDGDAKFNPYAHGIIPQFKGLRKGVPRPNMPVTAPRRVLVGVPRVSKPSSYAHSLVASKRAVREFKKQERERRSQDPSVRASEAYIPGVSAFVAAKLGKL